MTNIVGTLRDPSGDLINARLTITLDEHLIDLTTVPQTIYVGQVDQLNIVNGVIDIDLPESATSNVTYNFLFQREDEEISFFVVSNGNAWTGATHLHTDGKYYTGSTNTPSSALLDRVVTQRLTTLMDFRAIVPNQSQVEFAQLTPTGIALDNLDTSLRRVAYLLSSVEDYRNAIRGGPTWRGGYSPLTYYSIGDAVNYNGSSYFYTYSTPTQGVVPTTSSHWTLIASKGDAGGTGGDDTPYDPTGWNNVLDAPSKNALRDIIEQLARTSDVVTDAELAVAVQASLVNAALSGTPTAPTPANTDNSTRIATSALIKAVLGRYIKVSHVLAFDSHGGASINGTQVRALNTIDANRNNDLLSLTGNVIALKAGTYYASFSAPGYQVNNHRCWLHNTTADTVAILGTSEYSGTTSVVQVRSFGSGIITIAANSNFELRHRTSVATSIFGLGVKAASTGQSEVYSVAEFWRLD